MKRRRSVALLVLLTFVAGCNGSWSSGDRVLVAKYLYDSGLDRPRRFDVVVFRCPATPRDHPGPLDNFIKRLMGLAGETIVVFFGHLFVTTDWQPPGAPPDEPGDGDRAEWRKQPYKSLMRCNDGDARRLFELSSAPPGAGAKGQAKFQIIQKPPKVQMALRRIVYDNDYPARDLEEAHFPPRWAGRGASSWKAGASDHGFENAGGKGADVEWLGYRHILRPADWPAGQDRPHEPQLIRDFSGYNSHVSARHPGEATGFNWVGDLMLDFEVTVDRPEGELWLELARGVDRFRARWELATGKCTLVRLQDGKKQPEVLKVAESTALGRPGTHRVRFANFDERLTVWVDGELPFGDGVAYPRAWYFDAARNKFVNTGPTSHDLEPASIGSKGAAVTVRHLQLWRNTYYTTGGERDARREGRPEPAHENTAEAAEAFWATPSRWGPLQDLDFLTLYVERDYYLCLGDNSPESSDSRTWGLVPERLMLGRALVVYYPLTRAGLIH
jgi:signal peptidase I